MGRPYRLFFDHVLTRTDPEHAHQQITFTPELVARASTARKG